MPAVPGSGHPGVVLVHDDAVVIGTRGPASVGVARQHEQFPVRPGHHVPQPAELADVVLGRRRRIRQRHLPEPFPAQVRDPHGVLCDGDPAGTGLRRRPLLHRVDELPASRLPLDHGPAVVPAGGDDVEFVPGVLPELAGVHRAVLRPADPLHVAVTVAVHRRVREGIVLRYLSLRRDPQDRSSGGRHVLRVLPAPGIADGHVEHPVRAECEASSVVVRPLGQPVDDRLRRPVGIIQRQRQDAVVRGGGGVGVEVAAVDDDAEQSTLSPGIDSRHGGELSRLPVVDLHDLPAVPLADQHLAVVGVGHRPRCIEAGGAVVALRTLRALRTGRQEEHRSAENGGQ